MDVILNIGLARAGNSNIGTVIRECIAAFGAAAVSFQESDTETTCIACVDGSNTLLVGVLHHLCALLGHDCIAAYVPQERAGALIGPRAAGWGAFDPALFIMPDGRRLSEHNQVAKAA